MEREKHYKENRQMKEENKEKGEIRSYEEDPIVKHVDGGGLRYNEGKPMIGLIPIEAILAEARVLTKGAEKYAVNNWRRGMSWTSVINSMYRHLAAFEAGEDFDKETGESHLAHIRCNAAFLIAYMKEYPQGDDRHVDYLNPKRIGLDIDDVIADTVKHFCEYKGCETPLWWKSFDFRDGVFKELMNDKEFWLSIPVKEKPEDLLFEPVCYITSRSIPEEWTREWLRINNFPDVPLHSVGYGVSKSSVVNSYELDVFVDDRYENFVQITNGGTFCYLYDAPHNQRYDVGHRRLMTLKDLK